MDIVRTNPNYKKPESKKLYLTADEKGALSRKRELAYQLQYQAELINRDAQMFLFGTVYPRLGLKQEENVKIHLDEGFLEVTPKEDEKKPAKNTKKE